MMTISPLAGGSARMWIPDEPRAIVVICHGMTEHTLGYNRFATWMATQKVGVIGVDHIGHGLNQGDRLGDVGPDGWDGLARHWIISLQEVKNRWPDIPLVVLGHSMGSLVVQWALRQPACPMPDAAILIGTPLVKVPLARLGKWVSMGLKGVMGESGGGLIRRLLYRSFNQSISPVRTPFDWISNRTVVVDAYTQDPLCGFDPPTSFFIAFFDGVSRLYQSSHFDTVPPTRWLLMAGQQDPVADFGQATVILTNLLKARGANASMMVWPGSRHFILDDDAGEAVYKAIIDWLFPTT